MSGLVPTLVLPVALPGRSADRVSQQERPNRRPLPAPTLIAPRARATVCGLAGVDDRGRLADREIIGALGWAASTRLDVRAVGGLVIVAATAGGAYGLASRGRVRLPAPVRRSCGIEPGDRVLLVAEPADGVLVVHPLMNLDAMIGDRHGVVMAGDGT